MHLYLASARILIAPLKKTAKKKRCNLVRTAACSSARLLAARRVAALCDQTSVCAITATINKQAGGR
ncbi:MAG TPA: hypothetical protein DCG57_01655 [Candidatus Riflebacteria bacterium]|nr:hypothetical protein [Candidatus Riflebacteria bacterium]